MSRSSLEDGEALARTTYGRIAEKYYTPAHPTSRAFDHCITHYLDQIEWAVGKPGVHLDVGCGKTKLSRIPARGTVVLVDISVRMLLQSQLDSNSGRLIGSALHLPVPDNSVTTVYSFLGDAFAYPEFFAEVYRSLKNGGTLLEILPSRVWAGTLRRELQIPTAVTYFLEGDTKLFAPSIVYDGPELANVLSEFGFTSVTWTDIFLPRDFQGPISEHILIPARKLDIDPYQLPLLIAVWASK